MCSADEEGPGISVKAPFRPTKSNKTYMLDVAFLSVTGRSSFQNRTIWERRPWGQRGEGRGANEENKTYNQSAQLPLLVRVTKNGTKHR